MDFNDVALLAARICLSAVFIYSGFDKLRHWRDGLAEMKGFGLPLPMVMLVATIAVQLLGGLMVLFGIYARVGALALLIFTAIATLIGHRFWTMEGVAYRRNFTTALEHLGIIGGFLLIAAMGPGRLALTGL